MPGSAGLERPRAAVLRAPPPSRRPPGPRRVAAPRSRLTAQHGRGRLKFKEAQTNILVADTRSGMQVAAAEGKARKKDFSLGALGFAGGAVGGAGGYTNTNEGKVVAASFLDNYNTIVRAVRADPSLQRMAAAPGGAAAAGVKAGAVFAEGDVLVPKIANVKVFAAPAESGQSVGVLGKTDELVCTGEERNGYVKVQSGSVEGWVRKTLVRKP